MKKKPASKSAFFNPRVLTCFALCSVGVFLALLAFARQDQSGVPALAQGNIPVFEGIRAQEPAAAPIVSITSLEDNGLIDMATLGIHPLPAPLAPRGSSGAASPDGAAMGTGKAFLGITHEIVNQSTTNALGTLSSGWTLGESVQFYLNGTLAGTFAASATTGTVAVGLSTGAGFGYITVDQIGLTSGKETGGVIQVAPTGPYLPGVTGAPHAINTSAAGSVLLYGWGYPVSTTTTVTLYRNGVSLGFVTTSASGRFFVSVTPANSGDTSAVYSADTGAAGSMAGTSVEERSDAGTPPVGDQNAARAFPDRATVNSATGGVFALVGEGFQAGETVTVSGCSSATSPVDANGGTGVFLIAPSGAAVYGCVLTGGTSGRVARASVLAHANVTNLRGLIVQPAFVTPGGTVTVLADKLPPSDSGQVYLDGVLQPGAATTNPLGFGTFTLTKPATGFVHAVQWVATGGTGDAQATVLLLGPAQATPTPTASPTPTATATPSATRTPTPTPTASPSASPSASPTPTPCTSYTVTTGAGAIVPGTVDTGSHCDDCATTVALPFSFTLYDQTFATVQVGSNGFMSFGAVDNFFYSGCLPDATDTYTIFPFEVDQITGATGKGIFTSVSGTAPNRVFNIEWRACQYNGATTCLANGDTSYEVQLVEGTSTFRIIFGTMGSATATVGAVGVEKNGTVFTQYSCNAGGTTGQQLTFTAQICPTPTPTATPSATASPTATPSATRTPTPTPTASPSATVGGTPTPTPTPGGCSFSNGGLNPQPLSESGVAAPAGFFWSEVQHDTGNTTQANTNAGYADTQGTNRLADNFTLTQACTINNVVFYGYLTGAPATPSPFTAYTLQIHDRRPGDPGDVILFGDTTTNRLASSVDSTYFRIFNSAVPPPGTVPGTTRKIWRNMVTVGITLPAGTYWLDWASTVTGAANHFAPGKTIAGSRGAAGDNARQFAGGVWVDVTDVGIPASGTPVPQDFPFDINGVPTGGTPSPTATPTATATPSATRTPTPTPTASATATPSTPTPPPATPSPTTTPSGTPSPTTTPSGTPSPTTTPGPTPTPSASPTPTTKAINLSTRMRVQTGNNVGIGGSSLREPLRSMCSCGPLDLR